MSVELQERLRAAADGPVPSVDLDALRNEAGRRRRRQRASRASATAVFAVVVVVGAAGVMLPDGSRAPTVVDRPGDDVVVEEPIEEPGAVEPSTPDGWHLELVDLAEDEEGCALRLRDGEEIGGTLRPRDGAELDPPPPPGGEEPGMDGAGATVSLRDGAAALLCEGPHPAEEVREVAYPYVEVNLHPSTLTERHAIGLVDAEIVVVRLRFEDGNVEEVVTVPTAAPAGVEVRTYGLHLDDRALVVGVEGLGEDGRVLFEHDPLRVGFDIVGERGITSATTTAPVDDLPLEGDEPPGVDPLLGGWLPDPSPVPLDGLDPVHEGDAMWYVHGPGVGEFSDAEAVAQRLGSTEQLEELCDFLTEQVANARADGDTSVVGPDLLGEAVVHLMLRQEQVRGGDGLTATVAAACDLGQPDVG